MKLFILLSLLLYTQSIPTELEMSVLQKLTVVEVMGKNIEASIKATIIDIINSGMTPDELESWVYSHSVEDDGTDETFIKALENVMLLDIARFLRTLK